MYESNTEAKKLKDGKISLYIEYYKGSTTDATGNRKHLRDFEYLKLYLHLNPTTRKKENKESLELAENILAIKKANYVQGKFGLKNTTKSKRTFLNYFDEKTEEKQQEDSLNNYGNWFSTLKHLKNIVSPNMTFEEIDDAFIKK